jgi:2Fe-2S ferredoxin
MMLDEALDVRDNSRLSCQVKWTDGLDGLRVTLAPKF